MYMPKILHLDKVDMTTPTTDPQDGGFDTFLNYVATRDPTVDEPLLPYHGYNFLPFWWQTVNSMDDWATYTTSDFWLCVDNADEAMVWWRIVFDSNLLQILNEKGWQLNTARSYSNVSTPAFNTVYSPSSTNDTHVTAIVQLASTLLGSSTIQAQIDSGSGYVTRAEAGVSGVAATNIQTLSFICPANASYKLIASGGTTSIISINQLTS